MVGPTISHYKVLEKIGQGGMGEVFLAEDTSLDRKVALKFLPDFLQEDPTARKRFLREAKSAAALDHPFICKIYEVGETDGKDFISMEYVKGETLKDKLAEGPLALREALEKATEIAEALEEAHKQGIVHRDVKPSNIMLTPQGHVKVMDFGLAKRVSPVEGQEEQITTALTREGSTLGTVPYMSPEQIRAQAVDTQSDIFSFGIVFFEMLTGVHPFMKASPLDTASSILRDEPSPLSDYVPDVPEGLQHTVQKMLAKKAEQRYESGREVRVDLEQLVGGAEPFIPVGRRLTRRGWRDWLAQVAGIGGAPRIQSLAVLPLENLSGDPEQEYFAAGMHEALITDLAKLGGFKRVIARSSVMRYQNTEKPLSQVGRELGVDAVITGSVFREGDRVRITAQLINAATEEHLWADRYERELRDVLSLQNEIVGAITRAINLQLTPQEEARLASTRPVNPEAYEAYLKGRVHWYRQSPEQLETALEYFELALQKDPNYALAYAGIADTRFARGFRGVAPPREVLPKAKAAALKAVELDDTLAEAHGVLANARHWYEWDWAGAETEFRRAIELNPNYPDARIFYSRFLTAMRRPEEAMAEIRRALELDPFNYLFQYVYGLDLLDMRRYDDAVAQFRKTLRTEPNFPWAHRGLWLAFHQKRMYEEALAAAEKHFALMGKSEVAEALERGYAQAGYPGAMSLAGETLAARSNVSYVPAGWIAELYAYAGEKKQALEWLEKAYEEHDPFMVELFVGSSWDGLRDYAPFQDLLRRMG